MLNPTNQPTAEELRTADIVSQTFTDHARIIRCVVKSTQGPVPAGCCVIPDRTFEVHVPKDGTMATWWQVF